MAFITHSIVVSNPTMVGIQNDNAKPLKRWDWKNILLKEVPANVKDTYAMTDTLWEIIADWQIGSKLFSIIANQEA